MAEFKHGFEKAKMNKDLDERLIPNGEYRDANNIQISTSEGSNAGVVQNLSGNVKHTTIDHTANGYYGIADTATCVASIAAPDKDKIYYFISGSDLNNAAGRPDICKDYILEYNTITEKIKYVFVDIWRVKTKAAGATTDAGTFKINDDIGSTGDDITTINQTGVRIGMLVTGGNLNYQETDNIVVTDIRYSSGWEITTNQNTTFADNAEITFIAPGEDQGRVLKLSKDTIITGINILDDFIYWTDNTSEPKKINIKRSIAGTGGVEYLIGGGVAGFSLATTTDTDTIFDGDTDYFHTRLVRKKSNGSDLLNVITNNAGNKAVYINESHVTVIRPAPTQPLDIDMYRVEPDKINSSGEVVPTSCVLLGYNFLTFATLNPGDWQVGVDESVHLHEVGDIIRIPQTEGIVQQDGEGAGDYIPLGLPNGGNNGDVPPFSGNPGGVCFVEGDVLLFTRQEVDAENPGAFEHYEVRAEVMSGPSSGPDSPSNGTPLGNGTPYKLKILSIAPGIHSDDVNWFVRLETKKPLFEHAFPRFSYRYKYTDGEYSPFAPFSEIAFLPDNYSYEPKDGYNFGMVNQVRNLTLKYYHFDEDCIPQDLSEIDILYKETNKPTVFVVKTLKRSDVTPIWPDLNNTADTFLRGEFIVTTDMIHAVVPSNQLLRPWDNVPRLAKAQEISANRLIYGNYLQNFTVEQDPTVKLSLKENKIEDYAMPSVKTLRSYQVGVVYSDRYGRETPILTGLDASGKPNSMTVNKPASSKRNRLSVRLSENSFIPNWAEYMTYYVKEASTEYYTMASDRWYEAEDGNVWLSFPSSERNKLTEESFIELKKAHGTNATVIEPARFKILAIENEAPDEVKTSRKSLGVLTDNDTIGNAAGFGYPTVGLNWVSIVETSFAGIYPTLADITGRKSFVLKGGDGSLSREYIISSIVNDGSGMMKITTEESFDQDIDFTVGLAALQIEIFEHVVENKPEFDGRFFAKIRRNSLLDSYILTDNSSLALFPWGTFNFGYLNPNLYLGNPENSLDSCAIDPGDLRDRNVLGYGLFSEQQYYSDYTTAHPTEYQANWDGIGSESQYFWGQGNSAAITSNGTQAGLGLGFLNNGPSLQLAKGGGSQWQVWKNTCEGIGIVPAPCFFIDAAPAWSWTSKGTINEGFGSGPNVGDRPGCEYHYDYHWGTSNSSEWNNSYWGDAVSDANTGASQFNGNGGNMKKDFGQPSRGIWNGGICMDLSWTGMGDGATNFGGTPFDEQGPYAHRLDEWNASYASGMTSAHEQAWYFIQKLTTPGTKFRFKRDPRSLEDSLYTTTSFFDNATVGYGNSSRWESSWNDEEHGAWGIRNVAMHGGLFGVENLNVDEKQYKGWNMRQRWTITVNTPIGGDTDFGYSPIKGTNPSLPNTVGTTNFRRALLHDFAAPNPNDVLTFAELSEKAFDAIEIYERIDLFSSDRSHFASSPAVWETIPSESVDLDLYYQASGLIPLVLKDRTNEEYIPIKSTIEHPTSQDSDGNPVTYTVNSWSAHNQIELTSNLTESITAGEVIRIRKRNSYECTAVVNITAASGQQYITLHGDVNTVDPAHLLHTQEQVLDWNNCWSFGNGVESDRIRDDFNAPQIDNGVKVSSGIGRQVNEERRKHGLIWSGIYNSNVGVNDTNQFIMAESITKDLNPVYGSIQALLNRNTRLLMFCEDKVLRADTNKDLLFNADGNSQVVASNKVVGSAMAYQGDYGIATNPESIAENPYAVYFSDAMRGKVLRLTSEGVVPISDIGMKDYFADLMSENIWRCLGTYDERKNEYNLTTSKKYTKTQLIAHDTSTVTYNDNTKGWVSFKDFIPQHGATINNNYYTFSDGHIYKHHDETSLTHYSSSASSANLTMTTVVGLKTGMLVEGVGIVEGSIISSISGNVVAITNAVTSLFIAQDITFSTPHNTFYGTHYNSDATVVFNDQKSSVKSFQTINYEGSQAKINEWDAVSLDGSTSGLFTNVYATSDGLAAANMDDEEYFNLDPKNGWYIDNISTDLQNTGRATHFKDKEGKYFAYVTGDSTTLSNLDAKEFSVQGLGNATMQHDTSGYGGEVTVKVTNNTSSTYEGVNEAGALQSGGTDWDSVSVIAGETSKWACTTGSIPVIGGADIGVGQTLTFTLSPIINGVYSGTPVAAENLEWSGATNSSGTTWTNDGSTLGDPTDTLHINTVTFTNTGIAGDPSNTVTVTVLFKSDLDWPTSDVMWYIDIDEKSTHAVDTDSELRDVAFEVHWEHYDTDELVNVTPDNITTPDITETLVLAGVDGSTGTFEKWKFIGNDVIESDVATLVYSDTFTAATGYYFDSVNGVKVNMGVYEDQYQLAITPVWSSGNITSFSVKVYYTASSNAPMFPDPPNNELYNLGHKILLRYGIKPLYNSITDTITDVVYPPTVGLSGDEVQIRVYGNSGAVYRLSIQEKENVTSNTTVASGYYEHARNSFVSTFDVTEFTIPSGGVKNHYVSIPMIDPTLKTVNGRYDITVQAVGTTSLASGVPTTAGDASIIQHGWRSISITPTSFDLGRYDTLPSSEVRYLPAQYTNQPYKAPISNIITSYGGNGDADKNPITLSKINPNIKIGMRVVAELYNLSGQDGTGRGAGGAGTQPRITHGTTVTKVDGKYIDLSESHSVANNTKIQFIEDNKTIIPFSFQIEPPGGKTLALTNSINLRDQIGWSQQVSVLTNGTASGKTVTLDSIKGIKIGDRVTGAGIPAGTTIKVATLVSATQIMLDTDVVLANDVKLSFTNLHEIELINASKFVIGTDVWIRGHLQVSNITENVTIPILLDNIILSY
jgi:hypothetical protein